jgi:hypothetical protein
MVIIDEVMHEKVMARMRARITETESLDRVGEGLVVLLR